ncbi:hypothetical protein TSTA_099790 [Talaromyces stipitatus ATCC 10500]|uniref:PiggyBac transposable element-derived protein domain-containing protein n=1 Tax=Talaromyces stipitatus (strain ATCC 10500 / CBS 375.48 / QM 6759 / NRRL 1006) TaxID=441959 RepID=B8MMH5_TALSN|nr:uncharacterized protein TSTA_099790 [Talaromyces stipitatus ATCC 10500]EED13729.1 hypothetical protein TSTA_099790 [Talaromyces stipitatus ATCC 10500]
MESSRHQYKFICVRERIKELQSAPPILVSTTPEELKVFVDAQIYMGITKEPELKDYWDDGLDNNTVHANHPSSAYITQYRYEQLKRYFHIFLPPEVPGGFTTTRYPPEPILEQGLRMSEEQLSGNLKNLYIPLADISIDEAMVRSHGRSSHTFKLPNKPISQGFKLFVLADHGYVYYFYPTSRTKGVIEDERSYNVYLDNYFTTVDLFKKLRDIQIGAYGTTRHTSAGKDFPDLFKKLKDLSNYVPHHKVCAIPVRGVLCLTTIHTVNKTDDYVERERRRPQKTSTNGLLVHREFGD